MEVITDEILKHEARENDSHKGESGSVLVIAGSEDYAGAAVLTSNACKAVLRSGADLVVACCPEKIAWLVNNHIPDAITRKFDGKHFGINHVDSIVELAKEHDVILIGPGISVNSLGFAKDVIEKIKKPKVIDADAIKAIDLKNIENSLITPHSKEFEILLEDSGLNKNNYQENLGDNVLLLKGHEDRIISKDKISINKTGNAVMAKGGTGDVLAGLCAGFIAQGNSLHKSACMASYLNGAVGDILYNERGETYIASDIIENLHRVYH